ncbi:MAG: dTDP-4-dehydrorhamnose 3,5-epimerase [Allosphingosinicella sp.]
MPRLRPLAIAGVVEIVPERHGDARGFLSEVWSASAFAAAGLDIAFVQDNHSRSEAAGVLRGLHYQVAPFAQAKLVRVVRGAIFDVAVDLRPASPSFGRWAGLEISAAAWNQIFLPAGCAHGFVTLEPGTEVLYKVSAPYSPGHERTIRYDDPDIAIAWPGAAAGFTLSDKDRVAPSFAEARRDLADHGGA